MPEFLGGIAIARFSDTNTRVSLDDIIEQLIAH